MLWAGFQNRRHVSRPEPLGRHAVKAAISGRRTVLLASFGLAIAVLAYGVVRQLHDPKFDAVIAGVSGAVHESQSDVVAAADLSPTQSAWLIDRQAVQRRIEALPWVDQASITVAWPNRVGIEVTERVPVAAVQVGASGAPDFTYAIIDDSQRVLAITLDPSDLAGLPKVVVSSEETALTAGQDLSNSDVTQALVALRELRGLGLMVSSISIAPSTGISATANRNVHVLFGDDADMARKVQLFEAIVAKLSTPQLVAYVDVRSVHAPTVLYR
jgi:cell division septal protein FtsQ